jgi:hypothetical protein
MRLRLLLPLALLLSVPVLAQAGMPEPLPTEVPRVLRWRSDASGLERVQTISFFVAVLLLSTAAVQGLWNFLRRDFPGMPRLSFLKALAGVLLWGLLFIVVLAMISGARELMTPGAWKQQGWTNKLADDNGPTAQPDPSAVRRQHLEKLRTALWHFAATHNGRFPGKDEKALIPAEEWRVPGGGGLQYVYLPGQSASESPALLTYEPELDPRERFVLQTNGDIVTMTSTQLAALHKVESQP